MVTGTRAEYGLLYWLLRELREDPRTVLQIVATGAHLSPEFGLTYRLIEQDGFAIDEKVDMQLGDDSAAGVTKSLGYGTIGFAAALQRLKPDLLVLLGDRYEILAAAQAAMMARIPVAHIHGGESTEGLIDESIRHSVTKMSHLHFVSAPAYRKRVIQLGEDPARVFLVGAAGLDNIHRLALMDRTEVESALGRTLLKPLLLVTYHPVTLSAEGAKVPVRRLLQALDRIKGATLALTQTNADPDGHIVNEIFDGHAKSFPDRVTRISAPGQLLYLSLLKNCDVVIGNSSSGLLEAPSLGVPTVNIGKRQQGRLRAPSVIDCAESADAIETAIREALTEEFKSIAMRRETPYGKEGAAAKMKEILLSHSLEGLLMKKFHDLSFDAEAS